VAPRRTITNTSAGPAWAYGSADRPWHAPYVCIACTVYPGTRTTSAPHLMGWSHRQHVASWFTCCWTQAAVAHLVIGRAGVVGGALGRVGPRGLPMASATSPASSGCALASGRLSSCMAASPSCPSGRSSHLHDSCDRPDKDRRGAICGAELQSPGVPQPSVDTDCETRSRRNRLDTRRPAVGGLRVLRRLRAAANQGDVLG
jgi:hypothetical protein